MTDQCLICGVEKDGVESYKKRNEDGDILIDTKACKECRQVVNKRVQ